MDSISTLTLPELPTERVGWIAGYAILRGRLPRELRAGSGILPEVMHLVRQAEPTAEDREWQVKVEPIGRTPTGVAAILTTSKLAKGFFSLGSEFRALVHLDGDRILGANAGEAGGGSSAQESSMQAIEAALEALDSDALQRLARSALARAKALDTMQAAQYAAQSGLDELRASLDRRSAPL